MSNILVTAGSTMVMIDKVRGLTNVFKGRTGTAIAKYFAKRGHSVTLLTSNPSLLSRKFKSMMRVRKYRTFDQLFDLMQEEITSGAYDVVVHSSAVSDYFITKICVKKKGGRLVALDSSKKISSSHKRLYPEMVPTPKIIDKIRKPWGFKGYLVKFKLEVGITDDELLAIAKKSRIHSKADMIVANCLEWSDEYAYVCTCNQTTRRNRKDLPAEIEARIRKDMLWESE